MWLVSVVVHRLVGGGSRVWIVSWVYVYGQLASSTCINNQQGSCVWLISAVLYPQASQWGSCVSVVDTVLHLQVIQHGLCVSVVGTVLHRQVSQQGSPVWLVSAVLHPIRLSLFVYRYEYIVRYCCFCLYMEMSALPGVKLDWRVHSSLVCIKTRVHCEVLPFLCVER